MILMYICVCNGITERQVQEAIAHGASDLSDLQAELGVGTCCGCCSETAVEYLPGGRYAADVGPAADAAVSAVAQVTVLSSTELRRVA